jgi:putative oxidoreductase
MALRMFDRSASMWPKWRVSLTWSLQIILAGIFTFTASRKFLADPVPVTTVEALGTGQWLRVLIGIAELAGAIGLLIPSLARVAAACLATLMLGAIGTHVLVIGGSLIPAVALFVASSLVAFLLRKHARQGGDQAQGTGSK